MFELKDVKYKEILDVTNLIIKEHKITAIIGESGSGKTTLLKLLNKMISSTSGSIKYNQKNIDSYNPVELRKEIIMIPQTPIMFEGSIKDNLLLGFRCSDKGIPNDNELNYLLSTLKINKSIDDEVDNLSGGEKHRICVARAILLKPRFALLDEPTASLDEKTEIDIIKEIFDIFRKNNISLIIVTHSKNVYQLCDNIIELDKGKIVRRSYE